MNKTSQWNEFRWERELRKYDKNIAAFFNGIAGNFHLSSGNDPESFSEEKTLLNADGQKNITANVIPHLFDEEDSDGDEVDVDIYEPRRPVCFAGVDSLDQLAVMWNKFSISECSKDSIQDTLSISCAFAKALARIADFTESGSACSNSLLLALGKRAVADLEDIASRLLDFCRKYPASQPHIDYQLPRLALIREQMIDRILSLHKQSTSAD